MKTKASIQIDFQNAINQARKLEECAEEMKRIQRNLRAAEEELNAGWKGDSASLYLSKCQELEGKIVRSQRNLVQIASVILRTAKVHYDAELKSLEAINTQGSGGGGGRSW